MNWCAIRSLLVLALPATALALGGDGPSQKGGPETAAAQAKTVAEQVRDSKFWMEQKLVRSQNVLAGLTKGDFDAIVENGRAMNVLNYLEGYVKADVPEYKEQLQVFKFANGALIKAARNKNIEGATLAYTQLCVSCVNCHNVVRDQKKAEK
jgi:hypothetical protein